MGAFGSCLGVGRPVRPGANPHLLGSNLVNVDGSQFGPGGGSRQTKGRPSSYLTNGSAPPMGRGGALPKVMRQTSALSTGNQARGLFPHHMSPSAQAVTKLVDFDDNFPLQNSQSNCNNRQATSASPREFEKSFADELKANPANNVILYAKFAYEARTPEDLSFHKGEHLETTRTHMAGEWWPALSKSTKKFGYVPSNYVVPLKSHCSEAWYFGPISRHEAESRLRAIVNVDGAFIIRTSETGGPNSYSLSIKHQDSIKHYRIVQFESGGFYINKKTVFSTIQDLVVHYTKSADGLCINLREPCVDSMRQAPVTIGLTHDTHDKWEIDRNRLKVLSELGRGQFGCVYEGVFETPANTVLRVAIKMLRKGSMDPKDFLAEAQIMKRMHHENLVQLYAVCTKEEPVYIVTELMPKGALIDYLKTPESQKLVIHDFIYMATQIADGMAYLEREKYVHRDLAARNILVGEKNICKIADFGLARFISESEYEAKVGARFPIKWTAPEAAGFSKFTIKSDVWSFGIVMYELITRGGTPYPDKTNAEVIQEVERGYRMPKPAGCEDKYYSIMMQCWKKEANKRPTFETLKHDLSEYFESDQQYREPSQFMLKNR